MADPERNWFTRLIPFIVTYRWLLAGVGVLLTILSWPLAQQLAFDQSIESLYAPDDPHLLHYLQSKQYFGGDEFVFVAWSAPEALDQAEKQLTPDAAASLRAFSRELSAIEGVKSESTQNLADVMNPPNIPMLDRFLINTVQNREKILELMEGIVISPDRQTLSVVLRLEPEAQSSIPRPDTIARIREMAAAHDPPAVVLGEPVQIQDMFTYVEEDGRGLFYVSLVLLAIVILLLFRNVQWMILPLAVVLATVLWTEATLVLSRMQLSMVSSMLNSLITIISVATVTHITVRFRELRELHDARRALELALDELLSPVFWACLTTAGGFLALLTTSVAPVFSFGLMMGLGSAMVILTMLLLVPGGVLVGPYSSIPKSPPGEEKLIRLLGGISAAVLRHPRLFWVGLTAITAFFLVGLSFLRVETDFSKNFRSDSEIVRALDFFETRMGGAGTWEVSFPAPERLDAAYIARVGKLTERLKELRRPGDPDGEPPLTKVVSITEGLRLIPERLVFPLSLDFRLNKIASLQPEFVPSLYNPEEHRMRIVLRARERQSSEDKLWLINQVEEIAREEFPAEEGRAPAQSGGIFVLLTFLIESLMGDQLSSFALSSLGMFLMLLIAFRSFSIGWLSLIPNIFPIILVIGGMGWVGVPINIATAMIAAVSMGLTVDSSIHYIARYQRCRAEGMSREVALMTTQQSVGQALVFSNVALVIGFSVLTLSHFIPLIYFGLLVSVAMIGGLAGNLTLMPLLVLWVDREKLEVIKREGS